MGRTKSWLALVLAIVMVLGMAVPTAFAADPTIKLLSSKTWSDDAGVSTLTFNVGSAAKDLYVFDTTTEELATEENLGVKPTVEILDKNGDLLDESVVKFTIGDGVISVAPVSMTYNAGIDAKIVYTVEEVPYAAYDLNVVINPVVEAAAINLDALSNPSTFIQPSNFVSGSANTSDKIIIKSVVSSNPSNLVVSTTADPTKWNLLATVKGEYTLTTTVVLGSSTTDPTKQSNVITVKIPVHVGQAETNKPYKFSSDKAEGFSITRDANEAARTFKVWLEDANKTVLQPTAAKPFEANDIDTSKHDIQIAFYPTDSKSILLKDGTYGTGADFGTITKSSDILTTGKLVYVPGANLVSAKGKVVLKYDNLLMTEFAFEVKPVGLTVSSPINLDLTITAVGQTPAGATQYANVTPATGTYTKTLLYTQWSDGAPAGIAMNVFGSQLQFVATRGTAKVGTYKVKVMAETKISDTLTLGTEIKEITVNVVDNTVVPEVSVTSIGDPVSLDPANAPTKTYNYTVLKGLSGASAKFTLGTPEYSPATLGAQIDTLTFADGILTIKAKAAAVRASGKVTIKGTVDGIAIKPFEIKISIDDTTAGKPHHLVVTTPANFTELSGKISEGSKYLVLKVVDYNGNAYNATTYPGVDLSTDLEFKSVDAKGVDNGVVALRSNYPNVSGQVYVDYAKVGTGKAVFSGKAGTALAGIKSLEISTTITGMTLSADADSVSLDIKNKGKDAGKKVITFTTDAGSTINSITPTIPAADASSYTATVKNTNGVWTATIEPGSVAVKASKLVFNAMVDNFAATPITIPVTITGSKTLIASKDSFTFEMKETGIRNAELVITSSPEGNAADVLTVNTPKIADKTIVELTKTASDNKSVKYLVTALAKGTTTITFEGALGATGTLSSVTVDVTVVDEITEKTFVLAAAPIAIDLTNVKTSAVTWSVVSGVLTDVKVAALTGADFITISDDYKTITAKAVGTATIQATGKVDGLAAKSNIITITVTQAPVPTGVGVYIDGVKYADGADLYIPNNWKKVPFKVTLVNADDSVIEDVTLKLTVASGKKARLKINGTSLVPTLYFGKTKLTVTPKLAGATGTTIELDVERKPEANSTPVLATGLDNPQAGTRGYFFDYITSDPADAYFTQPKFWKFTSSSKSTANVKTNGIIEFKKAGTVTLKATKKSGTGNGSKISSFSVTLTVTDQYVNTASWAAVLSLSDKKADILNVYSSMVYPKGTNAQAFTQDKAGYDAMIAYLQSNAKVNDVSSVYIDGDITKSGLRLGTTTITLAQLAKDLAQVPGKIFLTMNGAGSTFYSGKDVPATSADIAKVFSAAEASIKSKTPMSDAGTNMFWSSQKFYILSATSKKSQTSVTDAKAGVVEAEFIKAMTLTNGKFFNGSNTVTLKELYAQVRAESKKNIGYYPSSVSGVAVGYYMVPAVNP